MKNLLLSHGINELEQCHRHRHNRNLRYLKIDIKFIAEFISVRTYVNQIRV